MNGFAGASRVQVRGLAAARTIDFAERARAPKLIVAYGMDKLKRGLRERFDNALLPVAGRENALAPIGAVRFDLYGAVPMLAFRVEKGVFVRSETSLVAL